MLIANGGTQIRPFRLIGVFGWIGRVKTNVTLHSDKRKFLKLKNLPIVDASNSVFIQAVNDAPAILEALLPRTATETQAFSLTVPQSAFGDIDGDVLTYTASLADNSSLPSWLSFDAVTRTFSGTPSLTDAGVLSIKVIANDGQLSANQVFTLTVNDFVVVNHPPELLSTPAILNNGTEDTAYTIQASDLLQGFSDVDGDTLSVINLSSSSGFLQDNQDGTYTFSPNPNFNGTINLPSNR